MKLMIIAALAGLGLIFGSFVNALIWRVHEQAALAEKNIKKSKQDVVELSIVKGRSMCSSCHHELAPKDLIPLFSWLLLRGKCRYCHQRIQDSPLIEAVLPIFFVTSYICWPLALNGVGLYQFIFWLLFLVGFMALAAYDLRWFILPDRFVFPFIGLAIVELLGRILFFNAGWQAVAGSVVGVVIDSGLFYALYQLSDGQWIGGGDVKLGVVLGILAGGAVPAMLILFIASMTGVLIALPQLITGKVNRTSMLPFGPYLLFAVVIVTLFGRQLITSYTGHLI